MSSNLEGGLGDVAIEVLHRLLSHLLLSSEEEVGVSRESINAFVQTLRRGLCRTLVHVYTIIEQKIVGLKYHLNTVAKKGNGLC